MTRLMGKPGWAIVGLMVASALAMPLSASAHGWGGHGDHDGWHEGWHEGWHGHNGWRGYDRDDFHRGYYHHGGYWSGGRWIAGAIVTGAVIGLVDSALQPRPVYYDPPVVYRRPVRVIYEEPVETRRVVETRTVYEDGYPTRYVRDDGDED